MIGAVIVTGVVYRFMPAAGEATVVERFAPLVAGIVFFALEAKLKPRLGLKR